MAGPNTTGKPNTSDYQLGRGILMAAAIDSTTGKPKAFRDLGNATEFSVTLESETQEHTSSRGGLRVVDKEVLTQQKMDLAFTLDEINHENLADFFSGEKATHTNVAVAGFSEYQMVADGDIELGRWYQIVNSSGERAYDIEAGNVVIKTTNGSPVTLVLNTDYELDTELGMFFILSTSTEAATAISNVEGLTVTLTADAGAKAVSEVRGLTQTSTTVALLFKSINPANNDKVTEYQFHQVNLKADGDFSLIGEDFTTMAFTGAAERNELADANSPTCTVRTVADS